EDAHSLLDRDPEAVVLVDPCLVGTAGHVAPPTFLLNIPANGLPQAALEIDAASIAQFAGKFCGVDRVAMIMAWPVGHVGDKRAATGPRSRRTGWKTRGEARIGGESVVEHVADQADDVTVVAFIAAADVIGFPNAAPLDHRHQRITMVGDVQPVTNVGAVAIDRQRLSFQCMNDYQWNQFFGVLVGTVIVRTIGYQDRHPIGWNE